jgi:hypothetical protein
MPTPSERKTIQARILAYAKELGRAVVPREAAERRRRFDAEATGSERANFTRTHRNAHNYKQHTFLDVAPDQCVMDSENEFYRTELPPLLLLKYSTLPNTTTRLEDIGMIRDTFAGPQKWLYASWWN